MPFPDDIELEKTKVRILTTARSSDRMDLHVYNTECMQCGSLHQLTHQRLRKRLEQGMRFCRNCSRTGGKEVKISKKLKFLPDGTDMPEIAVHVIKLIKEVDGDRSKSTYQVRCMTCGNIYTMSHRYLILRKEIGKKTCRRCPADKKKEDLEKRNGVTLDAVKLRRRRERKEADDTLLQVEQNANAVENFDRNLVPLVVEPRAWPQPFWPVSERAKNLSFTELMEMQR